MSSKSRKSYEESKRGTQHYDTRDEQRVQENYWTLDSTTGYREVVWRDQLHEWDVGRTRNMAAAHAWTRLLRLTNSL